jgi:hypothetical protein
MASSLSSSLLGTWDPQASLNIEKILDTINNLVRVLELTLTLNLSPAPLPPTLPPPATVILPKATTLGSGLDLVSPQSASELHSKVLTDRIASISKWAASVSHPTPSTQSGISPLSVTPQLPPTASSSPPTKWKAPQRPTKATPLKAMPCKVTSTLGPACPASYSARPANLGITHPIPPITSKTKPRKVCKVKHSTLALTCPASYSAGPANLGITHPIPPISPAVISAAMANLGITYPEPPILHGPTRFELLGSANPSALSAAPA